MPLLCFGWPLQSGVKWNHVHFIRLPPEISPDTPSARCPPIPLSQQKPLSNSRVHLRHSPSFSQSSQHSCKNGKMIQETKNKTYMYILNHMLTSGHEKKNMQIETRVFNRDSIEMKAHAWCCLRQQRVWLVSVTQYYSSAVSRQGGDSFGMITKKIVSLVLLYDMGHPVVSASDPT